MLRYKSCRNSIVTLELLEDSRNNEERTNVVDDRYAKFRCDEAKVISITNVETGEKMEKDVSFYDDRFNYVLGEVVKTWFSIRINMVCAGGIHYFKTEEAALSWYYRRDSNNFPDGKCTTWFENGQKYYEGIFKNGEKDGEWTIWFVNGNKKSEGTYKDNKFVGKWYQNGKIKYEGSYGNVKEMLKDGKWTYWYEDGQKESKETYKNGEKSERTTWYENGKKQSEGIYKDNTFEGKWWYENGKIKSEGSYGNVKEGLKDGKRTEWYENGGKWTYWYENGNKKSEHTYKNEEKDGKWTEWNEEGEETLQEYYNNGDELFPRVMKSLWKFNCQEANGRECEDGIGDGGILIFAETEDEALDKLFDEQSEQKLDFLPEFGHSDDPIEWESYNREEWKNKLKEIMEESPTYAFLVKFPSTKILL